MRPTRWELILNQKPIPLMAHLLEEVSRLFAKDLLTWPPPIAAFDPSTGALLQAVLAQRPLPPDARHYTQAFLLSRWDLERSFAAVDDYWRNQRHLESGLTAQDKPLLLLLARFVSEQLLSLQEATEGRVSRPLLIDVLTKAERQVLHSLRDT